MLEPGMELDADLGIDSIKRVEILSAFQERVPDAPAVDADDLGALQTLGQIVDEFAASCVGGSPTPATAVQPATTSPAAQPHHPLQLGNRHQCRLDRFVAHRATSRQVPAS